MQMGVMLCLARHAHANRRAAGALAVAPMAVSLLQARWRLTTCGLAKRKASTALRAEAAAFRAGRAASLLQRTYRFTRWRKEAAAARAGASGQLLAFAATKVQAKYRRYLLHRLLNIAAV